MMIDAITMAQIAMVQDQFRLQTISQNITNLQTPGYKRQLIESARFTDHLPAEMMTNNQHLQKKQIFAQGTVIQSQNAHDIALSGDGFFAVQTAEGIFYTRRGDLHVNERGELAIATGALILGKSGTLHIDDNAFSIDSEGIVYVDNHKIDQLTLVQFSQPQQLRYRGQGLYATTESPIPANGSTRVLQGFIEQSNVKSSDEMMELVKTSRHFQAAQRIMRAANGLVSTAINQLGDGNV